MSYKGGISFKQDSSDFQDPYPAHFPRFDIIVWLSMQEPEMQVRARTEGDAELLSSWFECMLVQQLDVIRGLACTASSLYLAL